MLLPLVLIVAGAVAAQASQPPAETPAELVKDARRLVGSGQVDEGLALYRRALQIQPDNFDANLGIGNALDLNGLGHEAREHFTRALASAPEDARAQVQTAIAVSYAFEANAKESATFYQQVFDKQMGASNFGAAAGTANALGRVYLETGDVENARRWYQTGYEAARRQPKSAGSQLQLWEFRWLHAEGRIAARAGRFDEARQKVAAAKTLVETSPDLKDQLPVWAYMAGYVELFAKQYDTALALLQQADQKDPFVLSLIARAQEGAGRADQAKATWKAVLESGAHNLQNAFARPAARKALR